MGKKEAETGGVTEERVETRYQLVLTLLTVEDRQEVKHEGPAGGSEEAPPVIPDGEVRGHDLDAEQDTWGGHTAQDDPFSLAVGCGVIFSFTCCLPPGQLEAPIAFVLDASQEGQHVPTPPTG